MRKLRRYATANRLNRFVTLTFAREVTQDGARSAVNALIRKARRKLGSGFAYVRVIGQGTEGGRVHVHLMLGKKASKLMCALWDGGAPKVDRLTDISDRRRVAQYLAHEFLNTPDGRHRYEVAEGFKPEKRTVFVQSIRQAREVVEAAAGDPVVERPLGIDGALGFVAMWNGIRSRTAALVRGFSRT